METDVSLRELWFGDGPRREQRGQHLPAVRCGASATHSLECGVLHDSDARELSLGELAYEWCSNQMLENI